VGNFLKAPTHTSPQASLHHLFRVTVVGQRERYETRRGERLYSINSRYNPTFRRITSENCMKLGLLLIAIVDNIVDLTKKYVGLHIF